MAPFRSVHWSFNVSSELKPMLTTYLLVLIGISFSRIGRFPPVVKTAVPVDKRFEHLVLSCNATSDHAIIWIERESQKALDVSDATFLSPHLPLLQ